MNLSENIRLAMRALTANKLRALLTMLGIIIGVAAVITLLSVGQGVEAFIVAEFEGLGNNLLFVIPGQLEAGQGPPRPGGGGLTNDDLAALSDPLRAPDVQAVVPIYARPAIITRAGNEARTAINGTSADFPEIRNFYPVAGSSHALNAESNDLMASPGEADEVVAALEAGLSQDEINKLVEAWYRV